MDRGRHHANNRDDWETPLELFIPIHDQFRFTLDACASSENTLLYHYYTEADDGFSKPWAPRTWCNPPFSRKLDAIRKAAEEAQAGRLSAVLLPCDTSTVWFRELLLVASEVVLLSGRVQFLLGRQRTKNGNTGGNLLALFGPDIRGPNLSIWDWRNTAFPDREIAHGGQCPLA